MSTADVTSRLVGGSARRLRTLGIAVPLVLVVVLEVVRYAVEGEPLTDLLHPARLAYLALLLLGIAVFASVMFRLIDEAQAHVLRQNRQLRAMNAVSRAAHERVGIDEIIRVSLDELILLTGARSASVTVKEADGVDRTTTRPDGAAEAAPDGPGNVEVPLQTNGRRVGTLVLAQPVESAAAGSWVAESLQSIGHHVADAIRLTQAVDDLQRRRDEGHAFYDILLQISNQTQPSEVLSAIAEHIRVLLPCDSATITLDLASFPPSLDDPMRAETTCPPVVRAGTEPGADAVHTVVPVTSGDTQLGEVTVSRSARRPLTGRDSGVLMTLSEFVGIAITNAHQRELGRMRAVMGERARIAREMHDSLAQVLGATHLRLRALAVTPDVDQAGAVHREIVSLADLAESGYRDVREAILGLREQLVKPVSFEESLRDYLAAYTRQCGIETELVTDSDRPVVLAPRCEVHLIRVVQEALTNVRKHSGATEATVRLAHDQTTTVLEVADNGRGFDPATARVDEDGEHFGLGSMRSRLRLLGGTLTIDSAPGAGTRLVASVPVMSHLRPAVPLSEEKIARVDPVDH